MYMTRLLLSLLPALALAQTSPPRFEVASVKPLDATLVDLVRTGYRSVTITDTRVDLKGQTLPELIGRAYNVVQDQVLNLPDAAKGIFFDVQATIPAGVPKQAVPEMLQALLAERFRLTVHQSEETRSMYRMSVGKPTAKLQPSAGLGPGKCVVEGDHRICHAMTMSEFATTLSQIGQIGRAAAATPGPVAAPILEWIIDRPVVDNTALEGRFDFPFDYNRVGPNSADTPPVRVVDTVTALGLKLDAVKQAFPIVIVDHVEKTPTGN